MRAATGHTVVVADRLKDYRRKRDAEALVSDLRSAAPQARIVVYSGYPPDAARIAHGGADAYVEKSAPFPVLEKAVLG